MLSASVNSNSNSNSKPNSKSNMEDTEVNAERFGNSQATVVMSIPVPFHAQRIGMLS